MKTTTTTIQHAAVQHKNQLEKAIDFVNERIHGYTKDTKKQRNKEILINWIHELKEAFDGGLMDMELLSLKIYQLNDELLSKKGEPSRRLGFLLHHLICQVDDIDFLIQISDSDIDKDADHPARTILKTGTPSFEERLAILMNLPNEYENPSKESNTPEFLAMLNQVDFGKDLSIIYVTGSGINPVGHAILKLGAHGYVQINTLHGYPQYICDDAHFAAYMRAQGGRVFHVQTLTLEKPDMAKAMLETLSQQRWLWEMTHHNCLTFVQDIAFAGGMSREEVGYRHSQTGELNKYPELPLAFCRFTPKAHMLKRHLQHSAHDGDEEAKQSHIAKFMFQADDYFEDIYSRPLAAQCEIARYYSLLRYSGLTKLDALQFTGACFGLHLTPPYRLQQVEQSIVLTPVVLADNASALFSAARQGLRPDWKKLIARKPSETQLAAPAVLSCSR